MSLVARATASAFGLGGDALEVGLGRPDLVGITQDHKHESFAVRLDADQVFAPVHDELADGDLAGLLYCLANDGIALVRLITVGREVIGLLPIAAIDLSFVNKAHHVDRVLGLQL